MSEVQSRAVILYVVSGWPCFLSGNLASYLIFESWPSYLFILSLAWNFFFLQWQSILLKLMSCLTMVVGNSKAVTISWCVFCVQIAAWKEQLDHSLPPPLDAIESWLSEVENLMSQTLPESGGHHNTMSLLQALSISFKVLCCVSVYCGTYGGTATSKPRIA